MKRLLIVLFLLAVAGGGSAAWWVLRDTPEKVLKDGIAALTALETVKTASLDVAITDLGTKTTGGFTFVGQLDFADLTAPRVLGVVRIAAKTAAEQDETFDLVIDKDRIAFRPEEVSVDHRRQYEELSGDPSGNTFISFERDAFLEYNAYRAAVASGKSSDLRATLQFLLPVLIPNGPLGRSEDGGRPRVSQEFRFDNSALRALLISLVKSWTGKTPTPDGYAWIERTANGLTRETFDLALDKGTRAPVRLAGSWSVVDDEGRELQRIRVVLDLGGVNRSVEIRVPAGALDVTGRTVKKTELKTLPGSEARMPPAGATTTPPVAAPAREKQIDVFSAYQEEIRRKKKQ